MNNVAIIMKRRNRSTTATNFTKRKRKEKLSYISCNVFVGNIHPDYN